MTIEKRATSATNFNCFFKEEHRHQTNPIPTRWRLKIQKLKEFSRTIHRMMRLDFTRLKEFQKEKFCQKKQLPAKRIREKPILVDEEIRWRFNQIRLGAKLFTQTLKYFRKFLRNFINFFAFNYKDLHEVIAHKIELV